MPKPTKVSNTPSKDIPRREGVLGRIQPVGEYFSGGIRMNVYGRNGSGKTTFACTFPKPLLLVGFEDGTRSVRKVEGVDYVRVQETNELHEIVAEACKTKAWKSVILDTATSLQDLILKELLGLERVPVQWGWGMVQRQQYISRSEITRELLRLFLAGSEAYGFNLVILAQEKNHSDNEEDTDANDMITPKIGSALGKSIALWLEEQCDYICQTYTRQKIIKKEVESGGQKINIETKTDQIEFCLRTQRSNPVYAAKMRVEKTLKMPNLIIDPSYDKLRPFIEE